MAEWDVLLAFDWSRITRNGEDFHWLRNLLKVNQRTAFEASTGLDIENVGSQVLSVMHEQYLTKLAADTHRGLRGKAERGLSAGGRPYGYRSEEVDGGKRLVIDDDHAGTVRRIFALYLAGDGLHAIVQRLSEEGVPSPRGGAWAFTAVREMLRNPIYHGEVIWNRSKWVKNHATGKRRRIERPESEWLRRHDESLRIIEEPTWQAAQREPAARAGMPQALGGKRRSGAHVKRAHTKRLLAGFMACGVCEGSFYAASRTRRTCGQRRDRGHAGCANEAQPLERELEARLFDAIESKVLSADAILFVADRTIEKVRAALADPGESPEKRAAEIGRKIENLIRMGEAGGDVAELGARIRVLEAERRTLLEASPAVVPAFDPAALRPRILRMVGMLRETLRASPEATRDTLRALFGADRVRVYPDAEKGFSLRATARLALFPTCTDVLVAGAGFEPATSGL